MARMQDTVTSQFILEIMNRPVIWCTKKDNYKNKAVTKRLWDEVADLFPGIQVDELKRKWKNLRDTYRKELKKSQAGNYESIWKHYDIMSFTKDDLLKSYEKDEDDNEDITDKISVKVENVDSDEGEMNSDPLQQEVKVEIWPEPETQLLATTVPVEIEDAHDSDNQSETNNKKKRPKDLREQYLEIERKKLKLLEAEIEKKSQDYYFLMSLLPEIEKLPLINKLRLRNKFNNALLEEMSSL